MSADETNETRQSSTLGKRANQVFALLWAVIGIAVLIQSIGLEYYADYGPGPGFLPLYLGVAFIVLGLALLAQITFSRKKGEAFDIPGKKAAWQMVLVMVGFFAFVYFTETVGFLLGLGLLYLFLLIVVERKGWLFSLAVSAGNVLLFWVVFERALKLRLPMGFLDLLR